MPYFENAENISVEYKIQGVYDSWKKLENQNIAIPDNLYGLFELELRVNGGFNSFLSKTYVIYIQPKWYQSNYFKGCMILLLASMMIGAIYLTKLIEKRKRIKLEQLIEERTFDLNHALERMTILNNELQLSEKIKENIVSVLAHDMRSPLMSVIYCIDDLRNNESIANNKEERDELLREINISLVNITQFSSEFLKWYALYRGGFHVNSQEYQLGFLTQKTISFYEPVLQRDNHTLELKIDFDKNVETDADIFKIIFRNLLDNANKYCYSKVIIESGIWENKTILSIKNDYTSEEEFPLKKIQEKLAVEDPIMDEKGRFNFGLGIISQLARVSGIDLKLTYENGLVCFCLIFP